MYEELVISGKGLRNLWNTDARKVGTLVHCQPPRAKVGTLYIAQCTNFRNVPTGFGTWQCTMYRINTPVLQDRQGGHHVVRRVVRALVLPAVHEGAEAGPEELPLVHAARRVEGVLEKSRRTGQVF